jgi:hypothetical protein
MGVSAGRERVGMRVAAHYEIHGNLPGLEAVPSDVREASVDRVVVGGAVVPGPAGGLAGNARTRDSGIG